uniref:Uncharacterized protein n=1 Tax=Arundo donax TaxID=35708 RepID=A0A0A9G646_ARUDO
MIAPRKNNLVPFVAFGFSCSPVHIYLPCEYSW